MTAATAWVHGLSQDVQVGGDMLAAWAESIRRCQAGAPGRGGLRFAFYGRVSTEDWQDPVTSRARQREQAAVLVAGHGRIVAEFFDSGESRVLPWARRPQAAALVAALADPDRGWDAIVIGEYERAFYGGQYASMAPLFEHYGVQLWMPEVGGRIDYHAEDHEQTMLALGFQSKREITRTRIRVRTAMATQTREQGRYLGGRPPYGYRLADAGPHPNKVHASWGRRAHRLEPDPRTAPVVRWIFAQRLAGHSVARIARALNEAGVPCPSAADPGRNKHRTGAGWTLGTVTTILQNPRYTGRQVWNRQRTDTELADPANVTLGHRSVPQWNLPDGWVIISRRPAHPALVSEADFIAAQGISAARGPAPGASLAVPRPRRYLLAGLLMCGDCGRRMEPAWSRCLVSYLARAWLGSGYPRCLCPHRHRQRFQAPAAGPRAAFRDDLEDTREPCLPSAWALVIIDRWEPAGRPMPPLNADERTTLESWLEFHRATLAIKCEGLDDSQAASASAAPSGLTLTGLVQHMAEVERNWFRRVLAAESALPIYDPHADPDGPDGGFDLAEGANLSGALAVWRAEIARARELCAARVLTSTGRFMDQDVSLRWIYVHMIEEYARHNGHADLLRERIDGTAGV